MFPNRIGQIVGLRLALVVLVSSAATAALAQNDGPQPVVQKIQTANSKVEMTVNTSRILSMDLPIPRAQVANPELLDFTVLSENQVQVHAKKAGITTVNLWDDKDEVHTVDVIISGDVRELERLLRTQFPTTSVKLFPTSTSVIISGYVDRPDYVNRIMRIAEDYYPKVINNMMVGGAQQVLLHVKVMEVSRTQLRNLGFDFANFSGGDFVTSTVSGIVTKGSSAASLFRAGSALTTTGRETVGFGIVNNPSGFVGFLEALKQNNLLKVLAEPDLVTVSGRPASYLVGGEVPYPMPTGFGNIAINFRSFGTQIDFVPIVLGNGGVRLEVRPRVSEIDPTLSITVAGTSVPGFRMREVETGVELKFGQTLAIAGLLQQRTQTETKGIPYLMDVPYLGAAFRRNSNSMNEVELLIVVRPELVEALDPDQVPPCGPGMSSQSPNDCDFYWKGHTEVPVRQPGLMGLPGGGPMQEQVPSSQPAPAAEDMPAARSQSPARGAVVISDKSQSSRTASSANRNIPASSVRAGSYNPSNAQDPKKRPQADVNSPPPGFLGPRGYDVRN